MASSDLLDINEESVDNTPRTYRGLSILGTVIFIAIVLVVSFELVYAGKIYPGVSANGVYLGGLSKSEAEAKLAKATIAYSTEVLPITYNTTTLRIPLNQLSLKYNAKVSEKAVAFGRIGSWQDKLHAQARSILGRSTPYSDFSYTTEKLDSYLSQATDEVDTTVQNATLSFNNNSAQVTPAKSGKRLDIGRLALAIENRLGQTSNDAVTAPVYELEPSISTESLTAASHQADSYVAAPISYTLNGEVKMIDQATIISWLAATSIAPKESYFPDFYPSINAPSAKVGLDSKAIAAYVSDFAAKTDRNAQNAALTVSNGAVVVAQESHDGIKLDRDDALKQITEAITMPGAKRDLILKADVTKAAISSETLASLGLTERISTATTYFPGSPYNRLTNVRVGASHFNGVILAPGEQFSFGKILGYVGPENGYTPGLVILNNHEEKAYGGGLCQVSSTAYRAALLAGLPINERYNHSFAISYYTAPYGVPGVDATIYYPAVDMKFTNDTGHYIFIQTHMAGSTLTFDYYGTKTKSGQIRGPFFVDGNSDETKPSTTVFYRDVLDLAGNVTKTDTVTTHYKSSLDYPVQD
jgi:vancomycin resistance protein YoaR